MLRTLYSKLAITLVTLILLLGLLFFSMMRETFIAQQLAVAQQLNKDLARQLLADFARDPQGSAADAERPAFDRSMKVNPSIEIYRLDPAGKILSYQAPEGHVVRSVVSLQPIRRFLDGPIPYPLLGDDPRSERRSKIFSVAPITRGDTVTGYLYVVIGGELQDMLAAQGQQRNPFRSAIVLMLVGLGLALFTGFIAFRLLTTRLNQLTQAMDRFRERGFTERVLYPRAAGKPLGDEIDRLGNTYNEMVDHIMAQLAELRSGDAQRRDLIANVSHDLRTPLTALRGYLDTMLLKGGTLSEGERNFYLETAAKQSERLSSLVSEFFDLAKLDARDTQLSVEPVMLVELVQDVLQEFQIAAHHREVTLFMHKGDEPGLVQGDIRLMERLLANLVDNALRHTPRGGTVSVAIEPAGAAKVRMTIADTGGGIPAEAIDRIFERSFTLDQSRSGESGGTGLGLAIVKRIVELHGGSIMVESRVGSGTRFIVDLPRGDPHQPLALAA